MAAMMQEFTIYGGLFLNALAAGSILPVQSEALLSLFLVKQQGYAWLLVFFATLGNTAGAIINWWLGKKIETFKNRKWFPASPEKLERARGYYNKFGKWCLLFSWVPVIGDALTVMAGLLKEKLWVFAVIVGTGKALRYISIAILVLKATEEF